MIEDVVHYIWVGDLSSEKSQFACGLGPKSLADLNQDAEICVWVQASQAEKAKDLFNAYPNIKIQSIDELLENNRNLSAETTKLVSNAYNNDKMPNVAKKDLVTQVILNEHGGYCFDTSTQFIDEPNLPKLKEDGFKVEINREQISNPDAFIWTASDVWALGSAANSKLLQIALKQSCHILKTTAESHYSGPMFVGPINHALDAILNNHGFYQTGKIDTPPTHEQMRILKEKCWIRDSNGAVNGTAHYIDELHLNKFTLGLWRYYDRARDFLDAKRAIYEYLGIELPPRAKLLAILDDLKQQLGDANSEAVSALISIIEKEKIDVNTPLSEKYNEIVTAKDILQWYEGYLKEQKIVAENIIDIYITQIKAFPVIFNHGSTIELLQTEQQQLLQQLQNITLNKEDLSKALKTLGITGQHPKIDEAITTKTTEINLAVHEQQRKIEEQQKLAEQQELKGQEKLRLCLKPYEAELSNLLEQLAITKDSLVKKAETNDKYIEVAAKVKILHATLGQEMGAFFAKPSAINFQRCHKKCDEVIKTAIEESSNHRGWHKVDPIIRGLLGVFAALTVIPALIVEAKYGYLQTFFAKPVTETSKNITTFKTQFEQLENTVDKEISNLKNKG